MDERMDMSVVDSELHGSLGFSKERLDRIERFLEERYIQPGKLPGALV